MGRKTLAQEPDDSKDKATTNSNVAQSAKANLNR